MIEIPVYSVDGKASGSIQVDETLLGGQVRPGLLKQAYVAGHANRRQGSAQTRSRGMVEGSTSKLYRQKGTGRARRGAIRTNVLRGGGVAFAKTAKSWRQTLPTKMRRLANHNALLSKIVDNELKIVDSLDFKAPKTKEFTAVLDALSINRTCLFAVDGENRNAVLSARNVDHVDIIQVDQLNAFDLLNHRFVLVEKAAIEVYLDRIAAQATPGAAKSDKEAA
jgi:large subunit ribosomal protein L4